MASRRRKVYRGRRSKYNINTLTWNSIPVNGWINIGNAIIANNQPLVQSSTVGGTRKVKNFQISMTTFVADQPIFWAVVYVPEGTVPSKPSLSGEGYQPSNYVLAQGMLTNQTPVKVNSKLSRNLNQNDSIYVVVWCAASEVPTEPVPISGFIQYAICYN